MADPLSGKRIVLGVTGSIAAFKAVALASELVKAEAVVDVIMTPAARRFIQPLSFEAIVHRPVLTDLFDDSARSIAPVSLGGGAGAVVVAPGTAGCPAGPGLGIGPRRAPGDRVVEPGASIPRAGDGDPDVRAPGDPDQPGDGASARRDGDRARVGTLGVGTVRTRPHGRADRDPRHAAGALR